MKHEKKFKMHKGKSYSNPSKGIWTGGTMKNLEHPGVRKAPGVTLSDQGVKGDPFVGSSKKQLNREIKSGSEAVASKKDINKGFQSGTFVESTKKRAMSDKMEGASPRIKSVASPSSDSDFNSNTCIEQKVKGA